MSRKALQKQASSPSFGVLKIRALPKSVWDWVKSYGLELGYDPQSTIHFCIRGMKLILSDPDRFLTPEGQNVLKKIRAAIEYDDENLLH